MDEDYIPILKDYTSTVKPFIFAIGGQIANIKGAKIPKFQPLEISLNCPETLSIRLTICSRSV
jgi:hypothetical protein